MAAAAARRRAEHARLSGLKEADPTQVPHSRHPPAPRTNRRLLPLLTSPLLCCPLCCAKPSSTSLLPFSHSARLSSASSSPSSSSSSSSSPSSGALVYYFSLRNQVHCLSYEPSRSISVRRYVHKRVLANAERLLSVAYHYLLYSPLSLSFLSCDRHVEPNRDTLDWNFADQLLAGQHEEYADSLKYRRLRFAVIPPTQPPAGAADAERTTAAICRQRIAAMDALWQSVLKKSLQQLDVHVAQPGSRRELRSPHSPLDRPPPPFDAAATGGEGGLLQRSHDAAVPSGQRTPSPSPPATPRPPSTSSPPSSRPTSPSAGPPSQTLPASADALADEVWDVELTLPVVAAVDAAPLSFSPSSSSPPSHPRTPQEVDDVLRSDVGFAVRVCPLHSLKVRLPRSVTHSSLTTPPPSSSGSVPPSSWSARQLTRDEWFFFQYEAAYHPLCCYHVEVHWLTASGVHVEGWCRQLQRKAERLGMALLRIPAHQNIHTADAFHQPITIDLTPLHPREEDLTRAIRRVQTALLERLHFVLDGVYEGSTAPLTLPLAALLPFVSLALLIPRSVLPSSAVSRRSFLHVSGCCLLRTLSVGFLFLSQRSASLSPSGGSASSASATATGASIAALNAQLFAQVHAECSRHSRGVKHSRCAARGSTQWV